VFIENDGNCAALYEISLNPKINNAIILVVGTGLGGAAIINRKLYKGSHDGAGEVGIGLSEIKNKKFINISNVSSMYAATNGYYQLTGKKVSGQKLFSLYPRDKHVKQLIDSMIYHLAKTLINLALFIDPEYVFIGGGVSKDKRFMSLLKMQVDYLMKMSQLPKMFKVLPCHDCNDANINGALTLIK
jgi:predicted NBD/HSP70 family sugar kinase